WQQTVFPSATPFKPLGAARFYLKDDTYRSGAAPVRAKLLDEIKQKTTFPPLILTGTVSIDTTLTPQAQRDVTGGSLGWHYDPIDFAVKGMPIASNATLTLAGGVVLAGYGASAIWLKDGAHLVSVGSPLRRNHATHFSSVQEVGYNWGGGDPNSFTFLSTANSGASPPTASSRFT